MSRPRVLLADDHTLVLGAFKTLLETQCDVVGTTQDGRALIAAALELKPDIVLLDIEMPVLDGLEAARQLKEKMPDVKVIFLTAHEDPTYAAKAFRAGASGYLLKLSATSELFQAIPEVLKGGVYVTPAVAKDLVGSLVGGDKAEEAAAEKELTPRQREVLEQLAQGLSMKEVGKVLNMSPRTVAFHKYRIMEALGIRTNAGLVQYAVKQGIVS